MCHIKRILLACQSNYLQTYSKPIMSAAGTLLCWAWKTTFCYAFHFVNLLKFINMHNVRDKTNMCCFYNIKMAVRGIITVSILFYYLFVVTMQILLVKMLIAFCREISCSVLWYLKNISNKQSFISQYNWKAFDVLSKKQGNYRNIIHHAIP